MPSVSVLSDDDSRAPAREMIDLGMWGLGPFENDCAQDLLGLLDRENSLTSLLKALQSAIHPSEQDFFNGCRAEEAVAAAELVAISNNCSDVAPPEVIQAWLGRHGSEIDDSWVRLARQAVEHVTADQTVWDLWDDEEQAAGWKRMLNQLTERLQSAEST
jgi:Domain of unknown function (DUF4259)